MSDKRQKLFEILAQVAERPITELSLEQKLKDDLELDSTQALDLLSTIEEEFDIEIDEMEAAKFETVADLLAKVGG
ncbi:MAG: acyl carrier protein [Planctomycetes bacterium]|nr:acyl carrier protein [Planctomycetota bacterium]